MSHIAPDSPLDQPKRLRRATAGAEVKTANSRDGNVSARSREAVRQTARRAARRAESSGLEVSPAEIEAVETTIDVLDAGYQIAIEVEVAGFARTSLETRALMATSQAALVLLNEFGGTVRRLRLVESKGGPNDWADQFEPPARIATIVVSDAIHAGQKDNRVGEVLREAFADLAPLGITLEEEILLPDDPERLREEVVGRIERNVDVVVTAGGTGVTHSDRTIEALEPLIDRDVPGIMEAARGYGWERTPYAVLSRGVAGIAGGTLVLTFPGSTGGARETCDALFPGVFHVVKTLRRSRHELEDDN